MALMFIIGCIGVLLMAAGAHSPGSSAWWFATVAGTSMFTAALLYLIN